MNQTDVGLNLTNKRIRKREFPAAAGLCIYLGRLGETQRAEIQQKKKRLADQILASVNALLSERGLLIKAETFVDATLITAPISTKKRYETHAPEMQFSRKGNHWNFGIKAYI